MKHLLKDSWQQIVGGLYWGTALALFFGGLGFLIPWAFFTGSILLIVGVALVAYRSSGSFDDNGYV